MNDKLNVRIAFRFHDAEEATAEICGREITSVFTTDQVATQTFATTMDKRRLCRSGQSLNLLTEDQTTKLFSESDCPFETLEEVQSAFIFELHRCTGMTIVEFVKDSTSVHTYLNSKTTGQSCEENAYVLTQLVRFGVLDRFQPRKKKS
jgi:hypothetical protein